MRVRSLAGVLALAAGMWTAQAQGAIYVDFNNDGDLGSFSQRNEITSSATLPMYAQDGSGGPFNGVNGTRGVTLTGAGSATDGTLVYTGPGAAQSINVGDTFTLSTLFKRGANTANGVYAQLGFLGGDAAGYGFYGQPTSGTPDVSFISLRLRSTENGAGTTATDRLELQTRNFPSGVATSTIDTNGAATGSDFPITEGNWYEYILTFNKVSGPDTFAWTASLLDKGIDGTAAGTAVFPAGLLSGTMTAANVANIYNDSSLYAAIRVANRGAGMAALDNFSVVPEPASLMGAVLGMGLLGLRRRRTA